jgi:hypothetical protein
MQRYVAGKLYTLGWFGPNAGTSKQATMQDGSTKAAVEQQSQTLAKARQNGISGNPEPQDTASKGSEELVQPVAVVEPVNWVSIATPHLGSWRLPTTWFTRTFNGMVRQSRIVLRLAWTCHVAALFPLQQRVLGVCEESLPQTSKLSSGCFSNTHGTCCCVRRSPQLLGAAGSS